jgi:hypothetical protein
LTVLKDGSSMGEVVFVDQGESGGVPAAVREALNKSSGSIPRVALSDGTATKVYGTSDHAVLVKAGLTGALRDAKRAMRDDQKNGPGPKTAAGTGADADSSSAAPAGGAPPSPGIKVTEKNGVKIVAGAPIEKWTSFKGTSIMARVTQVSGYQVTMVSDKGKTLTLDKTYLTTDGVARLEKILGGH